MIKLQANFLFYNEILGEIFLFNLKNFEYDKEYYFQLDTPRLKQLKNTFIKLCPLQYFYKIIDENWGVLSEKDIKKQVNALMMIRFKIERVFYSEKKLLKNSKLNGFGRIIDDNRYFSEIPKINMLTHLDNGIFVTLNHSVNVKYDNDTAFNWYKFKLTLYNNNKGKKYLKMAGGNGHDTL